MEASANTLEVSIDNQLTRLLTSSYMAENAFSFCLPGMQVTIQAHKAALFSARAVILLTTGENVANEAQIDRSMQLYHADNKVYQSRYNPYQVLAIFSRMPASSLTTTKEFYQRVAELVAEVQTEHQTYIIDHIGLDRFIKILAALPEPVRHYPMARLDQPQ